MNETVVKESFTTASDDTEEAVMNDIPYIAISNDELEYGIADTVKCLRCGETHIVEYSGSLAYYKCGDYTCLYGIDGKVIR
jgi:transposase-like protein